MGVLPCYRQSCKNIMCNRYSLTHGYICNECFEELVNLGAEANIDTFMKTEKTLNFEASLARFGIEFPLTD